MKFLVSLVLLAAERELSLVLDASFRPSAMTEDCVSPAAVVR